MEWKVIKSESTLYEIQELSDRERVLIFKFNPDSMVSFMIKQLLQREWNENMMNMKTYLIDEVQQKVLSDRIAEEFSVQHNAPQVLLIRSGKCVYTKSNGHIQFGDLKQFANR